MSAPPGTVLKPLHQTYLAFPKDKTSGRRFESVNCLRVLALEQQIADEVAAAHTWGVLNKKDYIGYNSTVVELAHKLHTDNGITEAQFIVSIREENGNKAHCDLELISATGTQKIILDNLKEALCFLFEKTYVSK